VIAVHGNLVADHSDAAAEHHASAFGLTWHSDIALDGFDVVSPSRGEVQRTGIMRVRRVAALADRGPGRQLNRGRLYADGVRLGWGDEVVFDMIDGDRIDYLPGPGWQGSMPLTFYSSFAAITLAWRGAIPFHACMVEVDGHAVLIAGPSGAGKSSLTAGLLGIGARLFADDLAVVRVANGPIGNGRIGNGRIEAVRGRPTMRQHRDTAARIDADLCVPIAGDPRDKWLVRPRARADAAVLPLAGLLVLTDQPLVLDGRAKLALLAANLFRPRRLAALPNQAARKHDLLAIAATIPVAAFPAITTFDPRDQKDRADDALARIRTMIAARATRDPCLPIGPQL
jgi:ABC-type cobalamin/Fe3+-siderophores transport system ATPase subunit